MMLMTSPDRNGDITRLRFKGMNLSYLSPCGYVAPAYYDSLTNVREGESYENFNKNRKDKGGSLLDHRYCLFQCPLLV